MLTPGMASANKQHFYNYYARNRKTMNPFVEPTPEMVSTMRGATSSERNRTMVSPVATSGVVLTRNGATSSEQNRTIIPHLDNAEATNSERVKSWDFVYHNNDENEGQQHDKYGNIMCNKKYYNGNVYEGGFEGSEREGEGKMVYANGDIYEGDWKDSKKDGYGKMIYGNKDVYEGDWKDDKMEGYGTMIYRGGAIYIGGFENDKRHGYGKLISPNKFLYEGDWKGDNMDGKGKKYVVKSIIDPLYKSFF
jgi:hypothetical protein